MKSDIKEVRELPEGWESLSVKSLGKAITGNTPPTKDFANYGGDIPFIKPTELIGRPVSVQHEILKFLEQKLSLSNHLMNELELQLLKAQKTKQSILASALLTLLSLLIVLKRMIVANETN